MHVTWGCSIHPPHSHCRCLPPFSTSHRTAHVRKRRSTRAPKMPPVAVAQRALSTLAKKLHPQLPLTPRESQQLLNRLTTTFRSHLDREHPPHTLENPHQPSACKFDFDSRDDHASTLATSSAALASQHLDAVLSNPLFAVKPSHRCSQSAASRILKDPLGWFINEIAMGTATLSKVSTCLDVLHRPRHAKQLHNARTPGAVIGGWLRSSGLDASKEFLDMCIGPNAFTSRLVTRLMADGEERLLWKWLTRPWCSSLSYQETLVFRKRILKHMVRVKVGQDLQQGLLLFARACDICREQQRGYEILRPAGQHLVQSIALQSTASISHELYNSFRESTRLWLPGTWARAVNSMLWLHQPTGAFTTPGLQFIQDPTGAAAFSTARAGQRSFVVQLSLGVARQLLEEERYKDAQAVMALTKQYFPDLVLSDASIEKLESTSRSNRIEERQAEEERNLELLNGLVPT